MKTDSEKRMAFVRRITGPAPPLGAKAAEYWAFSPDDKKRIDESVVFERFARISRLLPDPYDHENVDPPYPDIRATIDGEPYYFELGNVVDERVAKGHSLSKGSGEMLGTSFLQCEPLLRMFRTKCGNSYSVSGHRIDLVLHYTKQFAETWIVQDCLRTNQVGIKNLIRQSPFSRVWIFLDDYPLGEILYYTVR